MTSFIHSLPATSNATSKTERIPFWHDEVRQAKVAIVCLVVMAVLMSLSRCAEDRREADRQADGIIISEMLQEAR